MTIDRRSVLTGAGALCASGAGWWPGRARAAKLSLKYANSLPANYPHTVRMREAADRIRAESNGDVDIEVFPSSQLGSDTDLLSQVRSGAVDFITISGIITSTLVPAAAIHGVGFAWADDAKAWAALDGDLGAYVRAQVEKVGIHALDVIWDSGFRQITSGSRAINGPDDLVGFKIRVPVSPLWTSLFKALGAAPASLNFNEVYTALQTKIVDGQENALVLVETGKLFEVQKHVSMTNHMWDGNWFLCNGRAWRSLPADVRDLIARHVNESARASRQDVLRLNGGLEAQLASRGLTFNRPDPAPFRAKLKSAGFYKEWQERFGGEAWALLERYAGSIS